MKPAFLFTLATITLFTLYGCPFDSSDDDDDSSDSPTSEPGDDQSNWDEGTTPVSLVADKTSGQNPMWVELSCNGIPDDESISNWQWSFENQFTEQSSGNVVHVFDDPGEYEVRMLATSTSGATYSASLPITCTEHWYIQYEDSFPLFPFGWDGHWKYDVESSRTHVDNTSSEDSGSFELAISGINTGEKRVDLTASGKLYYLLREYDTFNLEFLIPEQIEIYHNDAGSALTCEVRYDRIYRNKTHFSDTILTTGQSFNGSFIFFGKPINPDTGSSLSLEAQVNSDGGYYISSSFDNSSSIAPPSDHYMVSWGQSIHPDKGLLSSSYSYYWNDRTSWEVGPVTENTTIECTAYAVSKLDGTYWHDGDIDHIDIVRSEDPTPGSILSSHGEITLGFSWRMAPYASGDAITVTADGNNIPGSYTWTYPTQLKWRPDEPFPAGSSVTLTISTAARSVAGTNLPENAIFNYTVAEENTGQAVLPGNG